MNKNFDIIIVGGGIVGLTTALLLAKNSDLKIALIEKRTPEFHVNKDEYSLRTFAINRASENILRNAGVWDKLDQERISPYYKMEVWDYSQTGKINFDSQEIFEKNLGYIIESDLIVKNLLESINDFSNIELFFDVIDNIDIDSEKAKVELNQNITITSKLLIGADGQNSFIRKLTEIKTIEHSYDQCAIVANIKTELPHNKTARQIFLKTGPLAFLPLPNQHICSIVWSLPNDLAKNLCQISHEEFTCELDNAFNFTLGETELVSTRAYFPLKMLRALEYCKDRVVLIGDAAHVIHPLAGQGVNLGLLDAATLVEVILKSGSQKIQDVGNFLLLRKYERWRKMHNILVQSSMTLFKKFFEMDNKLIEYLRNSGIGVLDKASFAKKEIILRALGIKGDFPDLAKGAMLST